MPLYEYECGACGVRFEIIQKFSDPPAASCTKCGQGPVHKLLSAPAIHFKGSGWYITDYARKGDSATTAPSGPSAPGSAGSGAAPTTTGAADKPAASEKPAASDAGAGSSGKSASSDSKPAATN